MDGRPSDDDVPNTNIYTALPNKHLNDLIKVQIFSEGHKILRNLHLTFVLCSASQKQGGDFAKCIAFSEYMNEVSKTQL